MQGRLTRAFGTTIASTILAIGIFASLLGYSITVRALGSTCAQTTRIVDDIALTYRLWQVDSRGKLAAIMSHAYAPEFLVVLNEHETRYEGRWGGVDAAGHRRFTIAEQPKNVYLRRARGVPFADRAAHWLAALAGYKGALTHVGRADVSVIADTAHLKAIAFRTIGVLIGLAIFAAAIGYAAGRAMARQALQPLVIVSEALETFAAGKLAAPVFARGAGADEFDRLALACNAAMETVQQAFAERARVELRTRQFVSDASHQLRTPLTVLRGFIGILRRREFDTAQELARIVETMDEQSAIMTSLMRKLMLLETWENGEARRDEIVNVATAVEQLVMPIAQAHGHRDLQLRLEPDAFAVIDPDELGYSIGNLVTNAINYASAGTIAVEVSTRGTEVHIVVADHGPGMSEDELAHAFDRFYRGARRDVPGSGLGLAIAKRAVERARGTLTVESTLGAGCRFLIALPRADVPAEDSKPNASLAESFNDMQEPLRT